jgi:hypothetical protein
MGAKDAAVQAAAAMQGCNVALWFIATSAGLVTVVVLRRPVVESRARRGDAVDGLSGEACGDRSRCGA